MICAMIRRSRPFAIIALASLLATACAATSPAPVERRGGAAPIERRGGAAAPATQGASAPATAAAGTVVVPAGATLYEIAEQQRVSLRALIDANDLAFPFDLSAGQVLRLPPQNSYTVVRGDTLNALARRFSIQQRSLALLNGLREPYELRPGQVLTLPGPAEGGGLAAAPRVAAPTGPAPRFAWPISGRVIDGFGPKAAGRRNDGVNIAAGEGDPVAAAANGLIVYAGSELQGYGNLVLIQHAGGWVSAYAHLGRVTVAEDQSVTQGQTIGEAGSSGAVDRPQLHFELRRDGAPVDPLSELPRSPS